MDILPQEYIKRLQQWADTHGVRDISDVVLENPRFVDWSASVAEGSHHYGQGGLVKHTFEVVSISEMVRGMYGFESNPTRQETYLASLFHDIGKLWDYQPTNPPKLTSWGPTPHKRRIHHISRSGIEWCRAVDKFPQYRPIEESVLHAILAHHGQREFGSPVAPKSRLSWLIHHSDAMSARVTDADTNDVLNRKL